LLTLWDANYPSILKTIADPPALLYYCGRLPNHLALALAVVEAAEKKRLTDYRRVCPGAGTRCPRGSRRRRSQNELWPESADQTELTSSH
jgi:hypothetical protein